MLELFRERDCILLLDEPDAFLHPEWQFDLIRQLVDHSENLTGANHILLTSHCASTLVSSQDRKINLFEMAGKAVRCIAVSKEYALRQLSAGMISLNEEKQTLSILCSIKEANKPILFTEGHTDQIILEVAWSHLQKEPIPFFVIQCFGCGYLRQLLQDPKIYSEASLNPIFGLFDFDEAYNDWNRLQGDTIETNPFKGLCRKFLAHNGYAYLLPVPPNTQLHPQVIKDAATGETYKDHSKISIEHMFYGYDETKPYFEEQAHVGGGTFVEFKGSKDHFAKQIVPSLPQEAFTAFASFFDSIVSKIPSA